MDHLFHPWHWAPLLAAVPFILPALRQLRVRLVALNTRLAGTERA